MPSCLFVVVVVVVFGGGGGGKTSVGSCRLVSVDVSILMLVEQAREI